MSTKYRVSVIMGSDSDWEVVKKAVDILKQFSVEFDVQVLSAHRTPEVLHHYIEHAEKQGIQVVIAAAGKAAHLAGVVASCTVLPVIGLPIKSSELDGLDALLSTVQMPPGMPVATVAINGSQNAALLAIQILALQDTSLMSQLTQYRQNMKETVLDKNRTLRQQLGLN